jgi:predicted N-formylglutamate amidohydrolase
VTHPTDRTDPHRPIAGTDPARAAAVALLGPADPPPFALIHPGGRAPLLVVCDHASRAFPRALGRLGLPEEATWRHIAWDIGAAELARALCAKLDAPGVLAGYSRLVIDCNRRLEDPSCFVSVSDGQPVPGNEGLGEAERLRRAAAIHEPYHKAIARRLHEFHQQGVVPALLAVHSFTPVLGREPRPWHVGVLWDRDPRIAVPLLERLRAEPGLVVGDNQPYSGRHPADYTIDHHAESAGLPHVCLEVRQDQLLAPAGIAAWAERLATALGGILADRSLYEIWQAREPRREGGSR